jgi:putative ABC transport system substrate-binding protein
MDSLLPQVDCLTNLTDNTVVANLPILLDKANSAGKPVFGSEIEQVKNGCLASVGVEYIALGQLTGEMAAQVLEGAFAGDIPFAICTESELCYNSLVATQLAIPVPADAAANGTDVTAQ